MGLEAQWNNAKLALRDANVDLESFDLERFNLELESALTAMTRMKTILALAKENQPAKLVC
jgi:hypothetical protein